MTRNTLWSHGWEYTPRNMTRDNPPGNALLVAGKMFMTRNTHTDHHHPILRSLASPHGREVVRVAHWSVRMGMSHLWTTSPATIGSGATVPVMVLHFCHMLGGDGGIPVAHRQYTPLNLTVICVRYICQSASSSVFRVSQWVRVTS